MGALVPSPPIFFLFSFVSSVTTLLTSMGLYMGHEFLCTGNDEKDVE